MEFKPENKLESLLMQAASDPAVRPTFYRLLRGSMLYVIDDNPNVREQPSGSHRPGYTPHLRMVRVFGADHVAVFTSLPRLQAVAREDATYVVLPAADLFASVETSMALNPGSPYGKIITREEAQSIADGSMFAQPERVEVGVGTEVRIGVPAKYPTRLADALSRYFRTNPDVQRAYLAMMVTSAPGDRPRIVVGISARSGWDRIVSDVGTAVSGTTDHGEPVDFVLIGQNEISRVLTQAVKPFYVA